MKVVSNTSPICYLLLIGQIDLLPALFDEILIPQAVRIELADDNAPDVVQRWITQPPRWIQVRSVTASSDPILNRLHRGEREAIVLAQSLPADLIILDEKIARQVARTQGLSVTGLLGILDEAATRDLLNLPEAVEHLRQTNFRASPRILKSLLDRRFRQIDQKKQPKE